MASYGSRHWFMSTALNQGRTQRWRGCFEQRDFGIHLNRFLLAMALSTCTAQWPHQPSKGSPLNRPRMLITGKLRIIETTTDYSLQSQQGQVVKDYRDLEDRSFNNQHQSKNTLRLRQPTENVLHGLWGWAQLYPSHIKTPLLQKFLWQLAAF